MDFEGAFVHHFTTDWCHGACTVGCQCSGPCLNSICHLAADGQRSDDEKRTAAGQHLPHSLSALLLPLPLHCGAQDLILFSIVLLAFGLCSGGGRGRWRGQWGHAGRGGPIFVNVCTLSFLSSCAGLGCLLCLALLLLYLHADSWSALHLLVVVVKSMLAIAIPGRGLALGGRNLRLCNHHKHHIP